jgi:hypothetical protein
MSSHWNFVEDAHMLQIAMGTDMRGVASAARVCRSWFTQLNRHSRTLFDQHPDVPQIIRNKYILLEASFFEEGTMDVVVVKHGSTKCKWFEFFELLADLEMTVTHGITNTITTKREKLPVALTAPRGLLKPMTYQLLVTSNMENYTLGGPPTFSGGFGELLMAAIDQVKTDKDVDSFRQVLQWVDTWNQSTQLWPLWRAIIESVFRRNDILVLDAFRDAIWCRMHWRERQQYFKVSAEHLEHFVTNLLHAYNTKNVQQCDNVLAFVTYATRHFHDAFDCNDLHEAQKRAAWLFILAPLPDVEDGDMVRLHEGIRLWIVGMHDKM